MSRLPIKIKEEAFALRSRGYSVKEIADKLNITKSTSSLWVRYIKLNRGAQRRLNKRKLLKYYKGGLTWQKKRIDEEKQYDSLASEVVDKITKNFYHFKLYCALLYWCEGGKNYKESVRFVNSDPFLVSVFLNLFRKSFKVDEKKFHILMHLHAYHDERKQKIFWSKVTKISQEQFNKTFRKPHTRKRIRENYPGCVALYYHDCRIARQLRAIYKIFSKQLGAW